MLDIEFGSAGDDNLQPRSLCGGIGQDPQETWATLSIATLVKCVNDKDEWVFWVVRKGVDEVKEKSVFHRLWSKVRVVFQVFCYNGSERWEDHGEFVDESRKDIYGLAQNPVVPPAENGTSKVASLGKVCTDGMGLTTFFRFRVSHGTSTYSSGEHSLYWLPSP